MRRLLFPTILLVLAVALYAAVSIGLVDVADSLHRASRIVLWIVSVFFIVRVAAALTRATFVYRSGHQAPALLVDVVAVALALFAFSLMAVAEFGISPTAAFTTSGVVIAVIGFAVRSLLADLFYGLTMAIERPFEIGHWIRLNDNIVGRVEEMTWRAVKLVTKDNLRVVVPNTLLAAEHIINFDQPQAHWRKSLSLVLDYDVTPAQMQEILEATVAQVPESAALPDAPDARIAGFDERGVQWELRYWLPNYTTASEVDQRIHETLLRNLRFAGIRIPRQREEIFVGTLEHQRRIEQHSDHEWIEHVELFEVLASDERSALGQRSRTRRIPAGVEIVRQGESGSSLFVVQAGAIHIRIAGPSGAAENIGTMGSGAVFGELSLLTGAPRSATVIASTAAMLHEITKEDLEPLLRAHPALAERFAEIVTDRRLADDRRADARSNREIDHDRARMIDQLLTRARLFFGLGESDERRDITHSIGRSHAEDRQHKPPVGELC